MCWEKYIVRDPETGVARVKDSDLRAIEILNSIAANGGRLYEVLVKFPELSTNQVRACQAWGEAILHRDFKEDLLGWTEDVFKKKS